MAFMPRSVLSPFAATRLALVIVGVLAVSHLPINAAEASGYHLPPQPHSFLEPWARYDACWYVAIAEQGYGGSIGTYGDMRPAFFPLFPAFVNATMRLVSSPLLAGLLVSNVCFLVFLVILWRIVRLDWTVDVARRA